MTTQNSTLDYAKAIQSALTTVVTPVPVYSNFNRNYATEEKFLTWQLRNVHQTVYTGAQENKGIDRPVFQVSVFTRQTNDAFTISDQILQSLHGFQGQFGGESGFFVSKTDIVWLYNTYDDTTGLNQVIMDCTLDVPA